MRRAVLALSLTSALLPVAGGCKDPSGPETEIRGKQLYDQYCARCHAADGSGVAEQPATRDRLNNPIVMKGKNDEQILGVIRAGKPPGMPGFSKEFTDAKLMVLTAYVRTLSGTSGRPNTEPNAQPSSDSKSAQGGS